MSDEAELIESETALAIPERPQLEYLDPVMDLATAKHRLQVFQEFIKSYLREGEDYGVIPGTKRPTLFKSGADKLCEVYALEDKYTVRQRIERWELDPPLFDYEVVCTLYRKGTNMSVCEGIGSCNSYESKYRWRDAQRKCPACGKEAIIKSKPEWGGGWYCLPKKGGCSAKFGVNDPTIVDQQVGRVPNPDIADIKNTILKMAKKRAKIDATIAATRSSGIFTQDVEDMQAVEHETQPATTAMSYGQRAEELKTLDQEHSGPQSRISSPQAVAFDNTTRTNGRTPEQIKQFLDQLGGYKQSTEIKKEHWDQARTWALNQTQTLVGDLTASVQQAQFKKIYAVAGRKRVSNDDIHKYIKEAFNADSLKELSFDQFNETVKWLEGVPPA